MAYEVRSAHYPQSRDRLMQAGAKDILFYVANTPQPENWLICITTMKRPQSGSREFLLHATITVQPVWGMMRGRRPTDEEVEVLKIIAPEVEWEEQIPFCTGNPHLRGFWEKTKKEEGSEAMQFVRGQWGGVPLQTGEQEQ